MEYNIIQCVIRRDGCLSVLGLGEVTQKISLKHNENYFSRQKLHLKLICFLFRGDFPQSRVLIV